MIIVAVCATGTMGLFPGSAGCSCSRATGPSANPPSLPIAEGNTWTYAGAQEWTLNGKALAQRSDTLVLTIAKKGDDGWFGLDFKYEDSAAGIREGSSGIRSADSGILVKGFSALAGDIPLFKTAAGDSTVPELFLPGKSHALSWSRGERRFRFTPDSVVDWRGSARRCMALVASNPEKRLSTLFFDPAVGILAKEFAIDTLIDGGDTLVLTRNLILDDYALH